MARPAPAEVPASRAPVEAEARPTIPAPPATVEAAPPKKRSVLVPALIAAGVLAVLVFGAFQLLGRRDTAAASQDATHTTDPKAPPPAPKDASTPR